MPTNTVMVEVDTPSPTTAADVERINNALNMALGGRPSPYRVFEEGGNVLVDVPESDNPVEEIRRLLERANVQCIVYDWNDPAVRAGGQARFPYPAPRTGNEEGGVEDCVDR